MSLPALAPEDLSVHRLRLRGPAGAADLATVRGQLDRAQWPRAPGDSWVLVRQIRVRGSDGSLAARASAALDERLRAAADAGSPGAERADAIRFRDLPDLLARLCADLAAGRAAERWYWRRWPGLLALSAGEAIGSLLGSHAERLTTVTERLAGLGALAPVWRTLTQAQALDLLGRLATRIGTPLPAGPGRDDGEGILDLPHPPAGLRRRWAPALAGLPSSDLRRRLAAALVALEWRPLWLSGAASAQVLDGLGAALGGSGDPAGATSTGAAAAGSEQAETLVETGAPDPSARGQSAPAGRPRSEDRLHPFAPGLSIVAEGRAAKAPSRSDSGEDLSPPISGPGEGQPAASSSTRFGLAGRVQGAGSGEGPTAARPSAPGDERPGTGGLSSRETYREGAGLSGRAGPGALRAPAADSERSGRSGARPPAGPGPEGGQESGPGASTDQIRAAAHAMPLSPLFDLETGEGGLFYLVNFLGRPEAQAILRAGRDLSRPGIPGADGWSWLWDLGRRLGLAREGALAAFLAERLGLPGADALAALPDLPAGPELLALGERLYGAGAVWGAGEVWGPDLLRVPARLRHSPSHLDIDYPLWAVRLPVRLVALDVSPGWVPWLGRVATFRYLEDWTGSAEARRSPR